jgi:decaprenylphospho-beta-D-erythro-pentofuranosid-2-ulose 2-reductase
VADVHDADGAEAATSAADAVRTALVLGGSSDIALAVVHALADRGLRSVVLAARDVDALEPRLAPLRARVEVTTRRWDALDVADHDALVDDALAAMGEIDLVVCAVGVLGHHAGRSMGPDAVDDMVRTNFAGPAAALAVVAERLVERVPLRGAGWPATIVVLSSVAAARPRRSNYVYGSSKAGLDAFARGLSDALVGTGVRVLVVRPGFVRSRMTVGLDPAPLSTDPETVAASVVRALGRRGPGPVVWVPSVLGPAFAVLSNVPTTLWRRVAGDR